MTCICLLYSIECLTVKEIVNMLIYKNNCSELLVVPPLTVSSGIFVGVYVELYCLRCVVCWPVSVNNFLKNTKKINNICTSMWHFLHCAHIVIWYYLLKAGEAILWNLNLSCVKQISFNYMYLNFIIVFEISSYLAGCSIHQDRYRLSQL